MDMWRYLLLLVFTIFSDYSIAENELTVRHTNETYVYSALDDAEKLIQELNAKKPGYGETWIMMPDGDGEPIFIILTPLQGRSENGKIWTIPETVEELIDNVKIYLYSKMDMETLHYSNLKASSFDPSKHTKIIIHGWKAHSGSSVMKNIKDAYLDTQDVNVIGIDWSYYGNVLNYASAAVTTSFVGRYVGKVIDALVTDTGASYDRFHIIGHSLGAHAAGFAGSHTEGRIARITGLDPALPGFQYVKLMETLDESDAQFVDVIHTCSGVLGMSQLTGHVDFFPNGGSPFQPGCGHNFFSCIQCCSHGRSHEFFAESIRHPEFIATFCPDWDSFKASNCSNRKEKMGEFVSKKARGPYYLVTHESSPYAMGDKGTIF